jgi:hypothetical protein
MAPVLTVKATKANYRAMKYVKNSFETLERRMEHQEAFYVCQRYTLQQLQDERAQLELEQQASERLQQASERMLHAFDTLLDVYCPV